MAAGRKTYFIGIAVSLAAVGLVLWLADPRQALRHLARVDWRHLLIPAAATAAGFCLRARRWQAIFPPTQRPTYGRSFNAMSIGLMANNFLPLHGGEFLRCGLVQKGITVAGSGVALSTVGLERILDGLMLAGVLLASLALINTPVWLWRLALASAALFTGVVVLLVALYHFEDSLRHGLERLLGRVAPRLAGLVAGAGQWLHEVLASVASLRLLAWLLLLSVGMRLGEAATIWGLALALGLPLDLGQILLMQSVLGLGLIIPAAPGYIGTYEALVVAVLDVFGVGADAALALALLMHAWLLCSTTVLGMAALSMEGLSLAQLRRARQMAGTGE